MSESPVKKLRELARAASKQRVVHLPPGRVWPWLEKLIAQGYTLRGSDDGAVVASRGLRRIKICRG
jgi:hypothetical protein